MGVDTHVLYNAPADGFQLCRSPDDRLRFTQLSSPVARSQALTRLGVTLRRAHRLNDHKIFYQMQGELLRSFGGLSPTHQLLLAAHFQLMLRLVALLNADQANHVFSHNDLLPGSVYAHDSHVAIVDWEYAAGNHCAFDLAWFSSKADLSVREERQLLTTYDPSNQRQLAYWVSSVKPLVHFFGLLWSAKKHSGAELTNTPLWSQLMRTLRDSAVVRASRKLRCAARLFVSSVRKEEKSELVEVSPSWDSRLSCRSA